MAVSVEMLKALGIWLAAKAGIGHKTKIDRIGRKAPYFKKIFRKGDRLPELRRELDGLHVMDQIGKPHDVTNAFLFLACD
jgi:hypothetical protein